MSIRPFVAVAALAIWCGSVAGSAAGAELASAPRPAAKRLKATAGQERQAVRPANKSLRKAKRLERRAATAKPAATAQATAPAVLLGATLLTEDFNSGIPAGWAVLDNTGSGLQWSNLADCGGKGPMGNYTGGTGDAACVSSDAFFFSLYDTELRTPVIDLSGYEAPVSLSFRMNFQAFEGGKGPNAPLGGQGDQVEFLDVDYSTNGAAGPWTQLLHQTTDAGGQFALPGVDSQLDASATAGFANVMFRFRYATPGPLPAWDWYAEIDDVVLQAQAVPVGCSLTCPANITIGTDAGVCNAVVTYSQPTPSGQCGQVECTPASGTTFALGQTTVFCNELPPPSVGLGEAQCSFNVTVVDDEAPIIACPADQQAVLPFGDPDVPVDYPDPTASDNCTNPPTIACAPPSGSSFPEGTSPVSCSATDAANLSTGCGFDVIVTEEGGGPVIGVPSLSSLGLAGLALLLAAAGLILLRRGH